MLYQNDTNDVIKLIGEDDAVMEIGPGAQVWMPEDSVYAPNSSNLTPVGE